MPFQLSPGVNVSEIDLTTIVPSVATSTGAIAGIFAWGPVNELTLIGSETQLVTSFGQPNANNAETWYTAANFLSYTNSLYVVRAANTTTSTANGQITAFSAIANVAVAANSSIPNSAFYANGITVNTTTGAITTTGMIDANTAYVAKYPGAMGNSLRVSICDTPNAFSSNLYANGLYNNTYGGSSLAVSANLAINVASNTMVINSVPTSPNTATDANTYLSSLLSSISVGDYITVGNSAIGFQKMQVTSKTTANAASGTYSTANISFSSPFRLSTNFTTSNTVNPSIARNWEFSTVVGTAPKTSDWVAAYGNTNNGTTACTAVDGIHAVVVDNDGMFTGTPGAVLETFANLSRATDGTTVGGATNYYANVINQSSKYIWWGNDRAGASSANAFNITSSSNITPLNINFAGGTDGYKESDSGAYSAVTSGYDKFTVADEVDISLILQGKPIGGGGLGTQQLANYLIDNIAEVRKDCVVFITPDDSVITSNPNNEAVSLVNWATNATNGIHTSSYAVLDSGYKYQYDRYNDVYRYVPMNGDIAGLCARTDNLRDPWWSPAGYNRGQIKNLVKLRYNPNQADRDLLYPNGINPVITQRGQGTLLFGDKTFQSKPSAFDHINVRRLFIVLEKAIARAAKYFLFEFNDEFTRAQFKALVNPYLRDIQGRRGITDYLVVCDATNNTPEVVDGNRFVGDIYIKPARSINYIQLNFVAVRTGVSFSEVVGKF